MSRAPTPLARLRAGRLRRAAAAQAALQTQMTAGDDAAFEAAQLARFNEAWAESLNRSPWARRWRDRHALPERFESWEALAARAPVQRKADLRAVLDAPIPHDAPDARTASFRAASLRKISWRATGGATAEPFRFPVFAEEARIAEGDHWIGRGRLGIDPADRLFLLWGHAHLFGSGLRGSLAKARRVAADRALGYTRWSAYDLSAPALAAAAETLARSGARYVIGYAAALDQFAAAHLERREVGGAHPFSGHASDLRAPDLHRLGLKAVIATAEAFPSPESRARIETAFGCPVVMEYGAMETGPLAAETSAEAGGFEVFFGHHRLELGPPRGPDGAAELLVTSLYPRATPLMRYAVGDLARPEGDVRFGVGLRRLSGLLGRGNDLVAAPSGAPLHSEAFTHALRDLPGLLAYQIVRGPNGQARRLRYEAAAPLPEAMRALIQERLGRLDPDLAALPLERADQLARSIAGKRLMVVDDAAAPH